MRLEDPNSRMRNLTASRQREERREQHGYLQKRVLQHLPARHPCICPGLSSPQVLGPGRQLPLLVDHQRAHRPLRGGQCLRLVASAFFSLPLWVHRAAIHSRKHDSRLGVPTPRFQPGSATDSLCSLSGPQEPVGRTSASSSEF